MKLFLFLMLISTSTFAAEFKCSSEKVDGKLNISCQLADTVTPE